MNNFEIFVLCLLVAILILLVLVLVRILGRGSLEPLREKLDLALIRVTEGFAANQAMANSLREQILGDSRSSRQELVSRQEESGVRLTTAIGAIGSQQADRLDAFAKSFLDARVASEAQSKSLREELVANFEKLAQSASERMAEQTSEQCRRLDGLILQFGEHRTTAVQDAKLLRDEVRVTLATLSASLAANLDNAATRQTDQLSLISKAVREMMATNEARQEALRKTVEERLDAIRSENSAKLEQMRATVDEKLQSTLEARLGASFTQVNENLERVYKSVGEMQSIATGVGDLKRVLTNVKSRGTWGEVTLGLLLEQVLTPEQYSENVEVRPNSGQRVEYAVKMPGAADQPVWLPIDAKMPTEDYERLVEASERGDVAAVEQSVKGIERAIKLAAKDISDKYICPPHSTDFALMFLPNEGIFAEVLRRPGLVDYLHRECRVSVAGPTNLMAMLTSIRMGFRSLAVQERSSEVWKVLGNVKHEFGKFGVALAKVEKKLGEAQGAVKQAGVRRRAVSRELEDVELLPGTAPEEVLAIVGTDFSVPDETDEGEDRE